MTTSKLDSTSEGTQNVWINYRGSLFTTAVMISSLAPDGVPFSRKVLDMKLLPVFDKTGRATKFTIQAALADSERIVYYPLEKYNDFSFDENKGTAQFTSRNQEFKITTIEESEAPQAPREETGDTANE